ncbi:MAG: hypothetical protein LIP15_23560, partial [Clostridium sp.]|nr:hypothetical protein [Clostridium sp.]
DLAGKSPQDIVFYNGLSLAAILLQNLDDKDIPKEELESFDKAFKRFVNVLEVIEPREFTRQFSSLPLLPFPYEKKRKPK